MNAWTKERLKQMISDGVEESLTLDYKRAEALGKTDARKAEITKDASSFANSAGGFIIYGIAEHSDPARRYWPERLDPIVRKDFSKEWLDQVMQTIQPRIEGLVIHPVIVDEQAGTVCYIVEVPQSTTAHQARDHRYHKRFNFNSVAMEDYEIRDAMNRRKHPRIRAWIYINRDTGSMEEPFLGSILVRLENSGQVMARFVMADLQIPVDLQGLVTVLEPVKMRERGDGSCWTLNLSPEPLGMPLFPGAEMVLQRGIRTDVSGFARRDGQPLVSVSDVRVKIFADEMPAISATLDAAAVLAGWTDIGGGAATAP